MAIDAAGRLTFFLSFFLSLFSSMYSLGKLCQRVLCVLYVNKKKKKKEKEEKGDTLQRETCARGHAFSILGPVV